MYLRNISPNLTNSRTYAISKNSIILIISKFLFYLVIFRGLHDLRFSRFFQFLQFGLFSNV